MNVEITQNTCVNSINMPITIHYVKVDGITIAECRDPKWANFIADAVKNQKQTKA
jgi:hypothetical protein